jgi:hypothetical protein
MAQPVVIPPITPANPATHIPDVAGANIPDLVSVGVPTRFQLLHKASSQIEGFAKAMFALPLNNGCVIHSIVQLRNPDGSFSVAESLLFVPHSEVIQDKNNGHCLIDARGGAVH